LLIALASPQILSVSLVGVASAGIIIMLFIEYVTDSKASPALSRLSRNIASFIVPFLIIIFSFMVFGVARIITG
jgi:hypothetical protein